MKEKLTKHTRHDEKRRSLPRLPSSRIIDKEKAEVMEQLYLMQTQKGSKLDIIIEAASFALANKESFEEYRKKLKNKQ